MGKRIDECAILKNILDLLLKIIANVTIMILLVDSVDNDDDAFVHIFGATLCLYDKCIHNKCINKFIINQLKYLKEQLEGIAKKCKSGCVIKDLICLNDEQKELCKILSSYIEEKC